MMIALYHLVIGTKIKAGRIMHVAFLAAWGGATKLKNGKILIETREQKAGSRPRNKIKLNPDQRS